MSTLAERINEALLTVIPEKYAAREVTGWYDAMIKGYGGGCDTCGYGADEDEYYVTIYFLDKHDRAESYRYDGTFADLIKEITV